MIYQSSLVLLCIFLSTVVFVWSAKQDKELLCQSCLAMVEVMEEKIQKEDPKKKIQTGSFRINPDGSQHVQKVEYARSEVRLHEFVEELCSGLHNYIDAHDKVSGRTYVVPFEVAEKPLKFEGENRKDHDAYRKMERKCHDILEDHEEDLISYLNKKVPNVQAKMCTELTDYCDSTYIQQREDFIQRALAYQPPKAEAEPEAASEDEGESETTAEGLDDDFEEIKIPTEQLSKDEL